MAEGPNGDSYRTESVPYITIPANPPTLSEIAEGMCSYNVYLINQTHHISCMCTRIVLQNGMQPLYQQLNVDIASCPCLTKAPYNLAGVGKKSQQR